MVIFSEGLCKIAEQYLKKGSKVYLEGQLQTRKYTDKDGVEKYSTEVVLQNFNSTLTMLDTRGGGGGGAESSDDFGAQSPAPAASPRWQVPAAAGAATWTTKSRSSCRDRGCGINETPGRSAGRLASGRAHAARRRRRLRRPQDLLEWRDRRPLGVMGYRTIRCACW